MAERAALAPGAASNGRPWSVDARRLRELFYELGLTTFRAVLRRAGQLSLTAAQTQALFEVARRPGCHVTDLARTFGVTRPAVTHLIDRLARKGLLQRDVDPDDRRACLLTLTARGARLVGELETLQLDALEGVLSRLSAPARRRAVDALESLVDAAAPAGRAANGHRPGARAREAGPALAWPAAGQTPTANR